MTEEGKTRQEGGALPLAGRAPLGGANHKRHPHYTLRQHWQIQGFSVVAPDDNSVAQTMRWFPGPTRKFQEFGQSNMLSISVSSELSRRNALDFTPLFEKGLSTAWVALRLNRQGTDSIGAKVAKPLA